MLVDYLDYKRKGIKYGGEPKRHFFGRKVAINPNSQEAQIAADAIERGEGYRMAWQLLKI